MKLFIPLFIFHIGSCNFSIDPVLSKNNIFQPTNIITYKKFEYPINNTKTSEFAYTKGDLLDGGTKAIMIYGDYCFFVDEVHRNIKKINLKDGTKTVSDVLVDSRGRSLVDITTYGNSIYVSSRQKEIFVLNSDLKLVRTIKLNTQGNNDILFKGTKGNNLLFLISVQDTLIEIDTLGNEFNRQKVSPYYKAGATLTSKLVRLGEIVNDTITTSTLDEELYYYTFFAEKGNSYLRGKNYAITSKENCDYFVNDKHKIKLAHQYTHLENTNIDFINDIDFNDKYLVIFEVTPPSITVYVYTIN